MPERSLILGEAEGLNKKVRNGNQSFSRNEAPADFSTHVDEKPASEEAGYNKPGAEGCRRDCCSPGLQTRGFWPSKLICLTATELTYCPLPAPEGRVDAAGATSDRLTGSTNNWPVTEVPGISVSLEGWPDLASAIAML
jgi:hypothetical protein